MVGRLLDAVVWFLTAPDADPGTRLAGQLLALAGMGLAAVASVMGE